ncbi:MULTISPECIES: hypothetical protein [unclassified Spirosoma]|uniref:hypothetical protein n=1 Tax=unclassified Spirosoma TaxID=2621999 RepID=UPI000967617F|nr:MULTISPECIES: hypothetical protein [unclassified Spirosoma]MBN8821560.1 hypothetical protein [Spirosoma sp.]OJW78336.1 MAG: hypothetical protein BGO59_30470 [Spirosoma sp. 48-14]
MTITFTPIELPFKVGATVYVNQEHGQRRQDEKGPTYPYFEAQIERIFFDGRLEEMSVIDQPVDVYELKVATAVYELKPIGNYSDLVKMPLKLKLPVKEPKLFGSEQELLDYLKSLEHIEQHVIPTKPDLEGEPS